MGGFNYIHITDRNKPQIITYDSTGGRVTFVAHTLEGQSVHLTDSGLYLFPEQVLPSPVPHTSGDNPSGSTGYYRKE